MSQTSKTFTREEKQEICVSYKQARDQEAQIVILSELNACPICDITAILKESGLLKPKRSTLKHPTARRSSKRHFWTDEEISEIQKLRDEGAKVREIADKFGVSETSIRCRLHRSK